MTLPSPGLLVTVEQVVWEVGQTLFGGRPPDLTAEIRTLSRIYNTGEDPRAASLAARLLFFTVADLYKTVFPLQELVTRGRIRPDPDRPLRVLDVGAGCGAQLLGLLLVLRSNDWSQAVRIDALDRDREALGALRAVVTGSCQALGLKSVDLRTITADAGHIPDDEYDLVLMGSVLNELKTDRTASILRLLAHLAPQGHLVLLEPALREATRELHRIRDDVLQQGAAHVFAPCTRTGPCPALLDPDDWCHERRPWNPPPRLRTLARATGLRQTDLKWSYLTLTPEPGGVGRPDQWRVVGDPLSSKGKLEIFVCGEAGRLRAMRLNRHRNQANRAFSRLRRGRLAGIEGGTPDRELLRLGSESRVTEEDPT